MRSNIYLYGTLAAFIAMPVLAQAAESTQRMVVTVDKLEGQALVAKTRDGKTETFPLVPNPGIFYNVKASVKDVKAGDYVTSIAMKGPDGKLLLTELHICPEELRGGGEGQRPVNEKITMTNATVSGVVVSGDGGTVKVKVGDMESELVVGPQTSVTRILVGDRAMVKAGAKAQINVSKYPDGKQTTDRIIIE